MKSGLRNLPIQPKKEIAMFTEFVKKYYHGLFVVGLVLGVVIGIFVCIPSAEAAEVTAFEMGFNFETAAKIGETSTADTKIYVKGEVDLHRLIVVDFSARGGFDGGEFIRAMDAEAGVWVRPIQKAGYEVLCGVEQAVRYGGAFTFDNSQTVGCKIRKPL